jgi:hypothetical protein
MKDIIAALNDLITDHWAKILTAAFFTVAGWLIARVRADRAWKRREFFNRLNISLNTIDDGVLKIRTLSEKRCSDVFLNEIAVGRLVKSAQLTTKENPFVPISQEDSWFYLNAVLNEVSEQFAVGLMRRELGHDVRSQRYVICLTNESDGDLRTRKIRAMVIRRELLEKLPKETPKFESPNHAVRWRTLQQMRQTLAKEPWRFIEAEIVV